MFLLPMSLMLVGGVAAALTQPENSEGGWAVAGVTVLLLLVFYPLIWRIRLRLSPEGVLTAAPWVRLETAWDNIERFYQCGKHAGFVTRRPLAGKGPRRLVASMQSLNPYDAEEIAWLHAHRYIPLRGFEHAVKSGAVEEAVQAWARKAVAPALPEPAPDSVPVWVWLLIAAIIGLAVGLSFLPEPIEGRITSILQFIALLAATVSTFARALLRWRAQSRTLGVMLFLLSLLLALLTFAALGWIVQAWEQQPDAPPASGEGASA